MTDEPLRGADAIRELKKQALDVYGTRQRFSEAVGAPDNSMGAYFRGERDIPLPLLLRGIDALGTTPEEFFAAARRTRDQTPKLT